MLENNNLAQYENAECQRIKNYINGSHEVLSRKDFDFNGNTFHTAKIVLQSIKPIIDFHSAYLLGSPVSITGEEAIIKLVQSVYRKGFFSKSDYEIAKNLVTYGNAYEYIYRQGGAIKSKVINNTDSYAIYENGEYTRFIERWCYNPVTDYLMEREYTNNQVREYENGVLKNTFNNPSGLPIHYVSGDMDRTNIYGMGIVTALIPIMNQIEELLSKMSDSVTTLSMNPMGVVSGQRLDESVDSDITGAVLNLDDGGTFNWATANLDYNSIKLILDSLINQFYTIASVPSAMYGNGNIANISETSLELLFNNSDSYAKRLSFCLLNGFYTRLQYISKMLDIDVTEVNIGFNYNKPVDNKSMMEAMRSQYEMGAISKESVIRNSPYTSDVKREMELIDNDNSINKVTEV